MIVENALIKFSIASDNLRQKILLWRGKNL